MASYVGRKLDYNDTPLLYSHVREDSPEFKAVWSTPKRIVQKKNKELELHYWQGLDHLKMNTAALSIDNIPELQNASVWSISNGILKGRSAVMSSKCLLASEQADFQLNCKVKMEEGRRCGLALRCAEKHGILMSLDYELQTIEVGTGRYHPALGWGADISRFALHDDERDQNYIADDCKFALEKGRAYHLRILMRDRYFEAYLDDRWIFTLVFNEASPLGGIEFFLEHGKADLSDLYIEKMEPLVNSFCNEESNIKT